MTGQKILLSPVILVIVSLVVLIAPVLCQSSISGNNTSNVSSNAYCFRFTWLGPDYDAGSDIIGATCTDLLNTYTDTPCTRPLIATNNGYLPDTAKLWERYKNDPTDIACRLTPGNVCVKYAHRYNNQYQNITYTCSKVTIVGEGPATSGCFMEKRDGFELEVCACRSRLGELPCNSAQSSQDSLVLFRLTFIVLIIFHLPINWSF